MSRNNSDTSLIMFNSIEHYQLDISRAALTSGRPLASYLEASNVDLFLSADEIDVQEAFIKHESLNAEKPLPEGSLAKLLKSLWFLQKQFPRNQTQYVTALVTARNSPAHKRVIFTLRSWGVRVDEAFFLGGVPKEGVLWAFGAQIFFDDQETYLNSSSKVVPTARVPYKQS